LGYRPIVLKKQKIIINFKNMEKAKKYKIWYQICLVVGVLGLIDIATHSIVQESYGLSDMGYLGIGSLLVFKFLFGAKVAATLAVLISTIFGFSIIWLAVAYLLNKKSKTIESPTEENQKKFKRAKVITWIIIGAILLISLYAIISFINSSI
jgi:hypothetical protein